MIFRAVACRVLSGLFLTGAGVAGGIFIAHAPASNPVLHETYQSRVAIHHLRDEYEAQLLTVRSRVERAESDLLIERTSRRELEKNLAQTQIELGYTRDQLAFFEELLPPGPAGMVRLRAADFDLVDVGLSYRVLFMRSGKSVERFCGSVQFVATGTQNGVRDVSVILQPLRMDASGHVIEHESGDGTKQSPIPEGFMLDFAQFQRSQGFLALPKGFEPKHVTVRVLNGSIVLASRRVDL